MRRRALVTTLALIGLLAGVVVACAPEGNRVLPGSSLTVATAAPVTSLNPLVVGQDTAADRDLSALTSGSFWQREVDGTRSANEGFGDVRVLSSDPLTVRYTLDGSATWSDGATVDAADLLLMWAARTTHRTDAAGETHWDAGAGAGQGLDLVSAVPEVGDDGRSLTLVYDTPYADWQSAFDAPPVAAHALVELAYPGRYEDPAAAKTAFTDAVEAGDLDWLAPVSRAFREDFRLDGDVPDAARVTAGAYDIARIADDGGAIDLVAADHQSAARIERVRVRAMADPAERVAAVAGGEADLTAAAAEESLVDAAGAAGGSRVSSGEPFDHLDLQTAGGGVFDPASYGGDPERAHRARAAFLDTVPRQRMLDELVHPLLADEPLRHGMIDATESEPAASPSPAPDGTAGEAADAAGLTVRVLYPAGDARRAAEFSLMSESASRAGVTLVDVSSPDWERVLREQPDAYDAALFAWSPDPSSTVAAATVFHTAAAQNVYGWSDETVDALVVDASSSLDRSRRDQLLSQLDDAVSDAAWALPLFAVPQLTVWSDALGGPPAPASADRILSTFASWQPDRGAATARGE
ncbi:ABC transporter substrate-binding protein [Microbacterium sp. Clip185]|uniref:ABC transporter substrate-binding protein n=1 Tax=Microbacterium sp. Clip185 TaxID=3025663 RepID=UPI002365023B|nr:ABC transporter substrate-binding protein [Microbacterium sp. Clip185]WDG16952.1 ABC transporter substrate-binding protein [Microbacterium sp. Clip185]